MNIFSPKFKGGVMLNVCTLKVEPKNVIVAASQYPFLVEALRGVFSDGVVTENGSIPEYEVSGTAGPRTAVQKMAKKLAESISSLYADNVVVTVATLALRNSIKVDAVLTDLIDYDDLDDLRREEEKYMLLMCVTIVIPGRDSQTRLFQRGILLDIPEICDTPDTLRDSDFCSSSPRIPFTGYFREFVLKIEEDERALSSQAVNFVASRLETEGLGRLLRENVMA